MSRDFPVTEEAYQPNPGGFHNGFLARFELPIPDVAAPPGVLVLGDFSLSVYPNPFNPVTTFEFSVPPTTPGVGIVIYNLLGQTVYSVDLGRLGAGVHYHVWDASALPSGVYISTLETATTNLSRKLVMVR